MKAGLHYMPEEEGDLIEIILNSLNKNLKDDCQRQAITFLVWVWFLHILPQWVFLFFILMQSIRNGRYSSIWSNVPLWLIIKNRDLLIYLIRGLNAYLLFTVFKFYNIIFNTCLLASPEPERCNMKWDETHNSMSLCMHSWCRKCQPFYTWF